MAAIGSCNSTMVRSIRPSGFTRIELSSNIRGEILVEYPLPTGRCAARTPLPSFAEWRSWLEQLVSDATALPKYEPLKYSKSGEVFRASFAGAGEAPHQALDVVCRGSGSEGGGGVLAAWRRSRAERNFHRALHLLEVGIDTAVPLAWIERAVPTRASWLVTEFVADMVDLDQVVVSLLPQVSRAALHRAKEGVLDAIVGLFACLDGAGLHHRDLKASNILFTTCKGLGGVPRPMLVDLDGLHPRRWWDPRERRQSLIRLAASLRGNPGLTRTDFLRFLHRYLSHVKGPTMAWKTQFRRLARDAAQYAQRSQRRKTHKLDGFTAA